MAASKWHVIAHKVNGPRKLTELSSQASVPFGLEFDVQMAKDKVVVVHDYQQPNGSFVQDCLSEELPEVVCFDEWLALFAERSFPEGFELQCELKCQSKLLVPNVLTSLQSYPHLQPHVTFISFQLDQLKRLAEHPGAQGYKKGLLVHTPPKASVTESTIAVDVPGEFALDTLDLTSLLDAAGERFLSDLDMVSVVKEHLPLDDDLLEFFKIHGVDLCVYTVNGPNFDVQLGSYIGRVVTDNSEGLLKFLEQSRSL